MKLVKMLCSLTICLWAAGWARAEYLPLHSAPEGQKPEVTILQQNDGLIQFDISLPGLELSQTTLEGKRWDRVAIPGGARGLDLGAPEVPHFSRLLIIPATKGVRAEFEALETTTLQDVELMPMQRFEPEDPNQADLPIRFDMTTFSRDEFYPAVRVMVGEPAIMRGLRLVGLRTNPIQYNPVTKELQVTTRYRITVHFEGTDLRNVPERQFPLSKSWGQMMSSVSFNYDRRSIDEQEMGSYLIISLNDPTLISNLQPLIEWKKRKGHSVTLQTFAAGASNTTIKNMIQTAYDTWPVPPEYVLLVGDVDGSYALAGWSNSGYMVDHPYSQLAGNDILADVALGRMPTSSTSQTQTMVNKVVLYERVPYTASSAWFAHGSLAAGYSGSSYSMYQTSRWIKTRMLWAGYTQVDTIWYSQYGGGSTTQMVSSINGGVTYFNYRGWVGYGPSVSQINGLTNGRKLCFSTDLTCGTGGFNGTSNMEAFATAGTPANPTGGIASMGMATMSTHVNFNNTIDYGIYAGIFDEGITQTGTSMNRGKLELYNAYQQNSSGDVTNFSNWCMLAGDPGVELFNGAIKYMTCPVPDQVTFGQNSITLTVNQQGGPALAGATACLYKANELQSIGTTDANGQVSLLLTGATAGNVKVTISKHNYFPVVDSLDVIQSAVTVGYLSSTIDDDNSGGSSGDNDGVINPGETVQIPSVFKNYGNSTTATGVSVTASETDSYVTLANATQTFPNLAPGASGNSSGSFLLTVANNTPNGHIIPLDLNASSGQGSWPGLLNLSVATFDLTVQSATASGTDTLLSAGETANFILNVRNNGNKSAASLTATLVSLDPLVTVNDASASFGTVNIGAAANCSGNPFNLTAATNTPPGHPANLKVTFSANAAVQVDTITIYLGPQTVSNPQGPDAYGYWCFDNNDLNYAQCPTFNWVEIDPGYGGSGTQLSLNDTGEDLDQSINVNLPFTFRYYGQTTNQITVCTNGWISTWANVSFTDFRNYEIPSPIGPNGHICPYWDDLVTSPGHVFAWNDAANHRLIVEWSRMMNMGSGSAPQQTFEVILYDPAYYPTPTNDGEIVFQYHAVLEVYGYNSNDNPFSTVGIESPDQTTGIEVVYWATYDDPNAAYLQPGRAYKFTTAFQYAPPSANLQITMTPVNPPIQIAPGGGNFNFDVSLNNNGTSGATFDAWIMQKLPSGAWQGPMIGPLKLLLSAGSNITRNRTQNVPGTAAPGTYYYTGYVGVYSYVKWDSSYFTYTKLSADGANSQMDNWNNWGESFEPWLAGNAAGVSAASLAPTEFALHSAYPNPFNPVVTIPYELPQTAHVKLAVYDIHGALVATLVDGMRDVGRYEAAFDGSRLASGVYIYRITAGGYANAQKMVLMK